MVTLITPRIPVADIYIKFVGNGLHSGSVPYIWLRCENGL